MTIGLAVVNRKTDRYTDKMPKARPTPYACRMPNAQPMQNTQPMPNTPPKTNTLLCLV